MKSVYLTDCGRGSGSRKKRLTLLYYIYACLTESSLRAEFPFSADRLQTSRHYDLTQNKCALSSTHGKMCRKSFPSSDTRTQYSNWGAETRNLKVPRRQYTKPFAQALNMIEKKGISLWHLTHWHSKQVPETWNQFSIEHSKTHRDTYRTRACKCEAAKRVFNCKMHFISCVAIDYVATHDTKLYLNFCTRCEKLTTKLCSLVFTSSESERKKKSWGKNEIPLELAQNIIYDWLILFELAFAFYTCRRIAVSGSQTLLCYRRGPLYLFGTFYFLLAIKHCDSACVHNSILLSLCLAF